MLELHSDTRYRIRVISPLSLFKLDKTHLQTHYPVYRQGRVFLSKIDLGMRLYNGKSSNDTTWRTDAT